MPTTFEDAFAAVQKLVGDFRSSESEYLSPSYQEDEARNDFINKFFAALGWDVFHNWQKNPLQQEVKLERGMTIGLSQRRADYAFYVAPRFHPKDDVRFFCEAKKPAGDIITPDYCFQTIRYGANAGTPLAVLISFRQLAVLDSRHKPNIATAAKKVLRLYDYADYAEEAKFREIFHLLSRDSVAAGSLETFAQSLASKRGQAAQRGTGEQPIGDAFLQELDNYRGILARAFKNRNPDLDGETLTEITQRTLDRLVFLRFLEDKGIETKDSVAHFGRRGTPWRDFVDASRRLNGIYNGIVFRTHKLDEHGFQVDDGIFADVCRWLSDPHSSYDFDKIPIHILGSIYEGFLGKVIVTTDKRARVEEKPEVRKAGGVHYTPEYISRYIVENTVGKLIAGKSPAQIAEMRFADIACGSGSFLLGVFDVLLQYHLEWFNANPDKAKKAGCVPLEDGAWHLSLKQRREILLNNIYGVDIDRQAVEVAQLSLYLKLLEEETTGTAREYQLEFHETLLPSLNKNIVCGNSLIGTDFSLDLEEQHRVNAMDFEDAFPHIFGRKTGMLREDGDAYSVARSIGREGGRRVYPSPPIETRGFDAIVGNPPYVRQESLSDIKQYLESHYQSFDGVADLYAYFVEHSLRLMKTGGLFSYIVSSSLLRARYAEALRRYLKNVGTVRRMVDFGGLAVFASAKDTYVCIPLIEKGTTAEPPRIEVCTIPSLKITDLTPYVAEHLFTIPPERFSAEAWALKSDAEAAVFEKVMRAGKPLGEYVDRRFFRGVTSGLNEAFIIDTKTKRKLIANHKRSAELIHPLLSGEDVRRYSFDETDQWLIFTRRGVDIHKYPAIRAHLEQWKQDLMPKRDTNATRGRKPGRYEWYEIQDDVAYYQVFDGAKIIFPDICKGPRFSLDTGGHYLANTAYCLGSESLYLLGLLNSRLFWFAISNISIPFGIRAGEYRYRLIYQYMEKVPIRVVDLAKPADKARHDRMVSLVEQMLAAQKQLAIAQSDADKDFYGNNCAALDRKIDAVVYELYALTEDEIELIKGNS